MMYLTRENEVLYPRTVKTMSVQDLTLMSNRSGNVIRITLTNTPFHEVRELRLREIRDEFDRIPTNAILGYEWLLYYENMQGTFYDDTIQYDEIGDFLYTYLMNDSIIEFIHELHDGSRRTIDCILHE